MTLYCFDIKASLIKPALTQASLNHKGLAELLTAIALAEQSLVDSGRFGPFGMTANQHQTVWDEYIARSPDLACQVRGLASQRRFLADPHQELSLNWGYATVMAALHCLYHVDGHLPDLNNSDLAAEFWQSAFRPDQIVNKADFCRHFEHGIKGNHLAA